MTGLECISLTTGKINVTLVITGGLLRRLTNQMFQVEVKLESSVIDEDMPYNYLA